MFAAVDGLAQQYARSRPGDTIDAHRADALADLIRAQGHGGTTVELLVPVLPLGSSASPEPTQWVAAPVEDPRHGALLPQAVARLLSDPDVAVRLARLEPDGSIVQDPRTYRPSASVARRVRSRDGGCRFPGCNTPARRTDLDHVVPWPRGRTSPENLICLCRTHHLFKHHGGWSVSIAPDGALTWTAPDARTWVTRSRSQELQRELAAAGVDAQVLHDVRRGWHPGLPVGMTVHELVQAEQVLPSDPPESGRMPAPPPDWLDLDTSAAELRAA